MMALHVPREIEALTREGVVIPASPLVLDAERRFDEFRQRVLMRYYLDAGAGGIAVGMHFTEFEIRRPGIDLYEPVLRTCAEEVDEYCAREERPVVRIAGIKGDTAEAIQQVETARRLGYHFAIASLAGWRQALEQQIIHHLRQLAARMPLFGFYLAPEFGGVALSYDFWRRFVDLENVYGIKIATFNRYATLDVARAVADAGRQDDIVLYTGNDDSIVHDLVTPFRFSVGGGLRTVRIRGGLLGQWACWTKRAVELLERIHDVTADHAPVPPGLLATAVRLTDANAAIFDAAHGYAGSIPGVKEVLRRQGLLESIQTLKTDQTLSPGQAEEISRVHAAYPELNDDEFVRANLDRWMEA